MLHCPPKCPQAGVLPCGGKVRVWSGTGVTYRSQSVPTASHQGRGSHHRPHRVAGTRLSGWTRLLHAFLPRCHGPFPSTLLDVHGAGGRRRTHTHCLGELDQNSCFLLGAGDTGGSVILCWGPSQLPPASSPQMSSLFPRGTSPQLSRHRPAGVLEEEAAFLRARNLEALAPALFFSAPWKGLPADNRENPGQGLGSF